MVKSILLQAKVGLISLIILLSIGFSYAFKLKMGEKEWLDWSNKCLSESFDPSTDIKLKKYEITLTEDHFLRLRKTYQHGKQEYFSFRLNKLDSVKYIGETTPGQLQFKTIADDIIVQTYEDPKGDIDSMATILDIPVKGMSPQRVDSLNEAIKFLKDNK
jgi:hypothetical protein